MKIDWISKLQNLLQTIAFCLAVATIQYAFSPDRPYPPLVAYSLFTGCTIWAVIDLGRHLLPTASETGWPAGWQGGMLVVGGIVTGFLVGNIGGDAVMRSLGLIPAGSSSSGTHLRSGLLITLLAGIAGSYWFYSRNKSAYLERRIGEAERHAGEARLKLLESQLEPHMLFNTLANLRALIAVDPGRAQQMLDHMIAYLRATLDASRATTHPLQLEFDRLRDYLELMAIRMGPRLRSTIELPAELAGLRVPTLLLQPVVENSILHGLEPKVEGGQVTVRAARDGDRLLLEVTDTGVGDAAGSAGKGFGLVQIRERLATLYAGRAVIDFTRDAHGACTRILLPIA
ncbi:sensor histidine kinase [Ramlibacter pallidus]|uniref:Histidine kinase n=1 Tax=Ramlibacter pallidus TaxID=2780087 RepID=A0ABR9S562_9BURK|nr:histidine kinase [Ramlibacter pallidus]MBE7368579.1 histidine kinase [Ramlibacter pallidus]